MGKTSYTLNRLVLNIKNTSYSSIFYQVYMFRGVYGFRTKPGELINIFIAGHGFICDVSLTLFFILGDVCLAYYSTLAA